MIIFGILILAIIGIVVAIAISRGTIGGRSDRDREDPVEILRIRYARGEITEEQFRKMMSEIDSSSLG